MGSADFRLVRPVDVTADGAFSRSTSKNVFDKNGVMVPVAANVLAVTYDPSNLNAAPQPSIEPGNTNLVTGSDSLTGAGWGYAGGSLQDATVADLAGGTKASRWSLSAYGQGRYFFIGGQTVGAVFTASVYYRYVSGAGRIWLGVEGIGNAFFDAVSGDLTSSDGNATVRVVKGVNGWRRLIVSVTATSASFALTLYSVDPTALIIDVFGMQFEPGYAATSYITSAATPGFRVADVIASDPGLVWSAVQIAEPTYNSSSTYATNAVVYDPVTRGVFQSLIDGNVGRVLADTTAWTPQPVTNRWRMFDKAVNSQTSNPEIVTVAVKPGALVNTLGLLNVAGSRVTVTQTDSLYSQSKSLVRHDVSNWYDWFYEEPIREGDVIFEGIPPFVNSTLIITVENAGDTAAIGACLLGKSRTIGQTAWDFTGGILSYSTSTTDTFGGIRMVRRDNSKTLNFEVYIDSGFESEAYRLLRDYTDVEMLCIGADDYSMTFSYGYLGQWSVPVTNSAKTAHIEWKGLV